MNRFLHILIRPVRSPFLIALVLVGLVVGLGRAQPRPPVVVKAENKVTMKPRPNLSISNFYARRDPNAVPPRIMVAGFYRNNTRQTVSGATFSIERWDGKAWTSIKSGPLNAIAPNQPGAESVALPPNSAAMKFRFVITKSVEGSKEYQLSAVRLKAVRLKAGGRTSLDVKDQVVSKSAAKAKPLPTTIYGVKPLPPKRAISPINKSNVAVQSTLPVPNGGPDAPGTPGPKDGGFDKVPTPNYLPIMLAPYITEARMVNGKVRFTFGGNDANRVWYHIGWSRPGQAEEFVRLPYHPGKMEEFIIEEDRPHGNTVYTFRVKGEGKPIGTFRLFSKFKEQSFRSPPAPFLSDKVKATNEPSPHTKIVDTRVQLNPYPIIGKEVLRKASVGTSLDVKDQVVSKSAAAKAKPQTFQGGCKGVNLQTLTEHSASAQAASPPVPPNAVGVC